MPIEQTIQTIIEEFGSAIWLGFITLVVTGFALSSIKGFIEDLVFYAKARFSDIGFGQRIYYSDNIYMVKEVLFRYLIIYDDKRIIRIPLKQYMSGPIIFPQPRYDDFDERKYHEGPWDGKTERRDRPSSKKPDDPDDGGGVSVSVDEQRRNIVDMIYAILLGPDRMKEIVPQLPDNVYHDAKRRAGKLSQEDFIHLNMLVSNTYDASIFERLNETGATLTREEREQLQRLKSRKTRSSEV
jgi:hypothetical protein